VLLQGAETESDLDRWLWLTWSRLSGGAGLLEGHDPVGVDGEGVIDLQPAFLAASRRLNTGGENKHIVAIRLKLWKPNDPELI
jgi:hypothetical protein